MKPDNWLSFKQGLNTIAIKGGDINNQWTELVNDIKKIVDFSFPVKTNKQKFNFKMSQGLQKSRDKKNRLLRLYKAGTIDKLVYINYNSICRKLIKTEQSQTFKIRMTEAGNNGKQKWKTI
jgi:hypothetical protein